jgi:ATP-binding cassette subfamily C (CFTR/MRP) protein 1
MDVDFDGGQKVIFQTGSFTGYRPLLELGGGYLSATEALKQPLCGNEEGWGPLSPFRYDFTPCFIDVWVASVAAFGTVAGLVAVWWLLKKKTPAPVSKDWHFWAKQVRVGASEGPC